MLLLLYLAVCCCYMYIIKLITYTMAKKCGKKYIKNIKKSLWKPKRVSSSRRGKTLYHPNAKCNPANTHTHTTLTRHFSSLFFLMTVSQSPSSNQAKAPITCFIFNTQNLYNPHCINVYVCAQSLPLSHSLLTHRDQPHLYSYPSPYLAAQQT